MCREVRLWNTSSCHLKGRPNGISSVASFVDIFSPFTEHLPNFVFPFPQDQHHIFVLILDLCFLDCACHKSVDFFVGGISKVIQCLFLQCISILSLEHSRKALKRYLALSFASDLYFANMFFDLSHYLNERNKRSK